MIDTAEGARGVEPVAIVGMGCRLAGGIGSPEEFWRFLREGRDAVSDAPVERWAEYAGAGPDFAASVRRGSRPGAYLSDVSGFDAEFFGVSPREAEIMDPQQRILLEVAWEALEHAGMPPTDLAGSDAGVFIGVSADDYGRRLMEDLPRVEAWTGIGSGLCGIANRVSYLFDLRGPSLVVDTACSGSLVSVHLACQSLRTGESTVALAGGVLVVAAPGLTLCLDSAGATSPDGRSKPFDAAADGYGRGEGCGVVVLKLLSDARRDGDRVFAVIRGSAVKQDGKTNGIMAPSGAAQEHLLRQAYRRAGLDPSTVDYVEAHGTGTRVGDPLEARALGAVFGPGRPTDRPCLIGSVKSNIGHLEAGAGVAGIIKTVLALGHGQIPPSLRCTEPNPEVAWKERGLRVVTEPTPWPRRGDGPRRAGVSAFGYGGTIAHVVLEEAPAERPAPPADAVSIIPLSGGSAQAVRDYAGALADWLDRLGPADAPDAPNAATTGAVPLASVAHTLALRRPHLEHRAAIVADGRAELTAKLRRLAAGEAAAGVATGTAVRGRGPVWVFSGHGAQWSGMGRELLAREPAFTTVIDAVEPVCRREMGVSPRRIIAEGDLTEVARVQLMTFVMQVGLAAVWRSYGVEPAAVIGHSVGEIAAAVVAGVLDLEQGTTLSARRSRLLRRIAGQGAMALVSLPFAETESRLAGRTDVVAAIAASPGSTVVSGTPAAVAEATAAWQDDDLLVRQVASDVAFHSPQLDALVDDLVAALDGLTPAAPTVPIYTTALDDPRANPTRDAAYWAANLRDPVRFTEAVAAAAEDGYRTFVEVSTHPVVTHSINETLNDSGDALVLATLRRNEPEVANLLAALGALHCHGTAVDWTRLAPDGDLVPLPPRTWRRRPYWRAAATGGGGSHDPGGNTLLGAGTTVPGTTSLELWRTTVTGDTRPYPGEHLINGVEVVPASVLLTTFFAATGSGDRRLALTDVALRVPLAVAPARQVQVVRQDGMLRIASREDGPAADPSWTVNTTALYSPEGTGTAAAVAARDPSGPDLERLDPGVIREHLAASGVPGVAFGWTVEDLARSDALHARVDLSEGGGDAPVSWAPALDAALSIAPYACPGGPAVRLIAHIGAAQVVGSPPVRVLVHVAPAGTDDTVDITVTDEDGGQVATLIGVRYARMGGDDARPARLVHEMAWRPLEPASSTQERVLPAVVLVGGEAALADALRERFETAGTECLTAPDADALPAVLPRLSAWGALLVLPPVQAGDRTPGAAAGAAAWQLARSAQHVASFFAGSHPGGVPPLWCLTTGVREARETTGLAQASLWGMGRVIAGEHPELWGGTIDLDARRPAADADVLLGILRRRPDADVIALRDGRALAARLVQADGPQRRSTLECHADGTYLITGGLGALGLEVARWLVGRGARRLALVGRTPLPARTSWEQVTDPRVRDQIAVVRALEALGVTVRVVALDISDADRAAELLAADALDLPPIRGVVHAAGVLDNRTIDDLDADSLRTVMRPKVDGAMVLHRLFPPGSVDFFVLFSSCGQLLRLTGQASYASANAFLDALAVHRQAAGDGGATSFGWSSWRDTGMAATVSDVIDIEFRRLGVAAVTPAEAFAAWDHAALRGGGYFAVLRVVPLEAGAERLAILGELSAQDAPSPAGEGIPEFSWELPPDELRERLLAEISDQIAVELKLPAADLDPHRSLVSFGLDSVMSLIVRGRLEKRFRLKLPATLLWHRPSVAEIADYLLERP